MGPLPIVVISLLVPTVILVFQFRKERARWGEQRRVLRSGEPAEATVLDRVEEETAYEGGTKTGVRVLHRCSVVLEVRRPGQPPYRARCKQWIRSSSGYLVRTGETVPVAIDRADPARVFIDVDAKLRAVQAEQEALRAKQLNRQDELMRG